MKGYQKLGKWVLPFYLLLNIASIFTIQTAVTIVAAGIAGTIFGIQLDIKIWSLIILLVCALILFVGKYAFFDKLIKVVVIGLSASTVVALFFALGNTEHSLSWKQTFPVSATEITFLIAFMGWMPAPLDVSVWQSLWTQEKQKLSKNFKIKTALLDFNIGYVGTFIIGICFLLMGALLLYQSGMEFSASGITFANQFLGMYTNTLGKFACFFIGAAAFTCMFSTTLTCLDASPRTMTTALELLGIKVKHSYKIWIVILVIGTLYILFFQFSEMGMLVKIATIISFVTAPFYAVLNHRLVFGKLTSAEAKPSIFIKYLSILGILFLIGFGIWFVVTQF